MVSLLPRLGRRQRELVLAGFGLRIPGIGRSTTRRLLAAGLLTDPEGVQRAMALEEMGRR